MTTARRALTAAQISDIEVEFRSVVANTAQERLSANNGRWSDAERLLANALELQRLFGESAVHRLVIEGLQNTVWHEAQPKRKGRPPRSDDFAFIVEMHRIIRAGGGRKRSRQAGEPGVAMFNAAAQVLEQAGVPERQRLSRAKLIVGKYKKIPEENLDFFFFADLFTKGELKTPFSRALKGKATPNRLR